MKYRDELLGNYGDDERRELTQDERKRLAMSFAKYNPGYRGPYGPVDEPGLRQSEPAFGAMVLAPGLRGLASMVKQATTGPQRQFESLPQGREKDMSERLGELLYGLKR
jgi:hypothetical protein